MSGGAVSRHLALVREMSKPGGVLSPSSPNVSHKNPQWWHDDKPRPGRNRLFRRLVDDAMEEAGSLDADRRAIVMAGPPGAGKGHIQTLGVESVPGHYLTVDPDDFKKRLLKEAIADGSYEQWLKPPELKALEAEGEHFFPLELAALVHEESSHLARLMRRRALLEGHNVLIDTVLSDTVKAFSLAEELEAHGYSIEVIDVEVPAELSAARIEDRWRTAYENALAGDDPFGGRWVPSEYAHEVFAGPDGRSRPEHAAREMADWCGAVVRHRVYWTDSDQAAQGATPTLIVERLRDQPDAELVDQPLP